MGGSKVRLMDVNTRRLSELKYKLVRCFKLAADIVRGSIRELVYDTDRPAFLKSELVGFGVDGYR